MSHSFFSSTCLYAATGPAAAKGKSDFNRSVQPVKVCGGTEPHIAIMSVNAYSAYDIAFSCSGSWHDQTLTSQSLVAD